MVSYTFSQLDKSQNSRGDSDSGYAIFGERKLA